MKIVGYSKKEQYQMKKEKKKWVDDKYDTDEDRDT